MELQLQFDGLENEQMFSHVLQVLAEEVEQDMMESKESENDDNKSPDSFVDDFDPFSDL